MWTKSISVVIAIFLLSAVPAAGTESLRNPNLAAIQPRDTNYRTAEAFIGELERSVIFSASISVPETSYTVLRSPREAIVTDTYRTKGEYVEKGTPIAAFSVQGSNVALRELELDCEIAASRLETELKILNETLDEETKALAKLRVSVVRPGALSLQELAVERARENRDYALYVGERSLALKQEDIAKLREETGSFTLTAPVSGIIGEINYMPPGAKIAVGEEIALMYTQEQMLLSITEGNLAALKYGSEVTIASNVKNFPHFAGYVISTTALLDDREPVSARALVSFEDMEGFLEFINSQNMAVDKMRFTVETVMPGTENSLLVPRQAVRQEGSKKYVNILEDGMLKKRYVLTGLSDTVNTQILEGINEKTQVILD